MIVTGISHVTIKGSADIIDSCVSFYTSVLNLRIGFRPPLEIPGFWLYAGEAPLVHLLVDSDEQSAVAGPLERLAFSCVNLPVTIRRLEDLGIDYQSNHLQEVDQFQIFLKDPAGLNIELNFPCEKI